MYVPAIYVIIDQAQQAADDDYELPEITVLEAMRCVPRDGVKWGKMTVNGERITASWAYHSEKFQRQAN